MAREHQIRVAELQRLVEATPDAEESAVNPLSN